MTASLTPKRNGRCSARLWIVLACLGVIFRAKLDGISVREISIVVGLRFSGEPGDIFWGGNAHDIRLGAYGREVLSLSARKMTLRYSGVGYYSSSKLTIK